MFVGRDKVLETDISNCEVNNVGDAVENVLKDYGWKSGPVCGVILHLSPDNERISNGTFLTRGSEDREFRIEAGKLWQDAYMGVVLTVRMQGLDSFSFSDGGMTSDLLPDSETVHFFHEAKEDGAAAPILSAELTAWGLGRFCIRLVCHTSKNSSEEKGVMVKYFVMIFPGGRAQPEQMSAHVTSASWPGIKLGEGEMPMLPRPTRPWGCPVLPMLKPGISFDVLGRAPSSVAMRAAITAVMNRSGAPDVSRSGASLTTKWEKFTKSPATFATTETPVTWPAAEQLPAATGERQSNIITLHAC